MSIGSCSCHITCIYTNVGPQYVSPIPSLEGFLASGQYAFKYCHLSIAFYDGDTPLATCTCTCIQLYAQHNFELASPPPPSTKLIIVHAQKHAVHVHVGTVQYQSHDFIHIQEQTVRLVHVLDNAPCLE